jgi:hypothetical protein
MFKTVDYGKSWTKITNGIPSDEYCRVLREDPTNLDYCLLELSEAFMFPFNDGDSWQKTKLNANSY